MNACQEHGTYRRGDLTRQGTVDHRWHAHVRMGRQQYLDVRAWLAEWGTIRPANELGVELARTVAGSLPAETTWFL